MAPLSFAGAPDRLAGSHAVVSGGAGFVGSWLCQRLVEAGARVTCVDNLATGCLDNLAEVFDCPGFRFVEADLAGDAAGELEARIPGPVDWVLHLASPASPVAYSRFAVETLRLGSVATLALLDLARRTGARFLLASTSEVYGDPAVHPQPESYWGHVNPVGPRSMYDEAKRFAEAATVASRRSDGTDATVARIFNSYGPRMSSDDGRVIPTFVGQALAGEPLTVAGDGTQTRSLCYVDDTVTGLLRLLLSTHSGPVNIGNDEEITVLALAEAVRSAAGSDSAVEFVPLPPDDPKRRCPDLTLAREILQWSPTVPMDEGLRRTVTWFRESRGRG